MSTIELRVTRPSLYPRGADVEGMQGHYISGDTYAEAMERTKAKFPNEPLVVQLWKQEGLRLAGFVTLDQRSQAWGFEWTKKVHNVI